MTLYIGYLYDIVLDMCVVLYNGYLYDIAQSIPLWYCIKQTSSLHQVNFYLTATEVSNIESAEIHDRTEVQLVAKLFGVDSNRLYKGLTSKTIYTREEAVTSSLSHDASLDVRDAFVKVCKTLACLSVCPGEYVVYCDLSFLTVYVSCSSYFELVCGWMLMLSVDTCCL